LPALDEIFSRQIDDRAATLETLPQSPHAIIAKRATRAEKICMSLPMA
jgi:hypothetical protein